MLYQIVETKTSNEPNEKWTLQVVHFLRCGDTFVNGDPNQIFCFYYSSKFVLTGEQLIPARKRVKEFCKLFLDENQMLSAKRMNELLALLISGKISPMELVELIKKEKED